MTLYMGRQETYPLSLNNPSIQFVQTRFSTATKIYLTETQLGVLLEVKNLTIAANGRSTILVENSQKGMTFWNIDKIASLSDVDDKISQVEFFESSEGIVDPIACWKRRQWGWGKCSSNTPAKSAQVVKLTYERAVGDKFFINCKLLVKTPAQEYAQAGFGSVRVRVLEEKRSFSFYSDPFSGSKSQYTYSLYTCLYLVVVLVFA
eukprot:Filipodium_phascolosomae@DN2668_c0_g1_i4.p1